MHPHSNMAFVTGSIVEYLGLNASDRVLCVLPLSFGYGLYQLLTCVRVGATLVLEPGFAFAGRVVQLLEEERDHDPSRRADDVRRAALAERARRA